MSEYRKSLVERMVKLFGENHPVVGAFISLCKNLSDNEWNDKVLFLTVHDFEWK